MPKNDRMRICRAVVPWRVLAPMLIAVLLMSGCGGQGGVDRNKSEKIGLSGTMFHDFGEVVIENDPITLSHTFRLTNSSLETIEVDRAKTSCGCAVASISSHVIRPGDDLLVEGTLKLSRRGTRDERIQLVLKDHRLVTLSIRGTATRKQDLVASASSVLIWPTSTTEIILAKYSEEPIERPSAVEVRQCPAGIVVHCGQWNAVGIEDGQKASRFHCIVTCRRDSDGRASDDSLILLAVDGDTLSIHADGSPWHLPDLSESD